MRRAGALMAALLAVFPVSAEAATVGPDVLRAALSDPLDDSFVESSIGDPDTLQGPFDAVTYANVEYTDADIRHSIQERLKYEGFIAGYGRTFYKESVDAWLIEAVFAFGSTSDARSFWGWEGDGLTRSSHTTRIVDTTAIPSSVGADYIYDDVHATEIQFARGNDVFNLIIGSSSGYMTTGAVAQAVQMHTVAPENTVPVGDQREAHPGPVFVRNIAYVLALVVGIAFALSAVAGAIAVVLLVRRSRRQAAPASLLSADGLYWWDGQAWRPTAPR